MIYEVENKKTKAAYTVDEKTYKALDKKKFTLLSSWDETRKQKAIIPQEIIIKSTESVRAKVEKPKAK